MLQLFQLQLELIVFFLQPLYREGNGSAPDDGVRKQDRFRGPARDPERKELEFIEDFIRIRRQIVVGVAALAVGPEIAVHSVLAAQRPVVAVVVEFLLQ